MSHDEDAVFRVADDGSVVASSSRDHNDAYHGPLSYVSSTGARRTGTRPPRPGWSHGIADPETRARTRCEGTCRNGKPCGKPRLRGARFCQTHLPGGRKHSMFRKGSKDGHVGHVTRRTELLGRIYTRVLSKTLREALDEHLSQDPSKQVQIFEELGLMREHSMNAVALWSIAQDSDKLETRLAAGELMAGMLKQVADLAKTAAAINAQSAVSVHTLHFVVQRIINVMHEVCGEENISLALEFEQRVRAEIRVEQYAGGDSMSGTTLTPDRDAIDMDESVPRVELEATASSNGNGNGKAH